MIGELRPHIPIIYDGVSSQTSLMRVYDFEGVGQCMFFGKMSGSVIIKDIIIIFPILFKSFKRPNVGQ